MWCVPDGRWHEAAGLPSGAAPPRSAGLFPAALMLDGKKLAAFSTTAGRFLRFPIGDRRCNGTRASASKRPVTRAQALQTRKETALALDRKKLAAGSPRRGAARIVCAPHRRATW